MKGILLTEIGDIAVENRALSVGDNATQCAQMLVGAATGEFKHAPLLGGNSHTLLGGKPGPFWAGALKRQLKQCLVEATAVEIADQSITIELK